MTVGTLAACGGGDSDSSSDDRIEPITNAFSRIGAPEDEARGVAEELSADTTPKQVTADVEAVIESDAPATVSDGGLDLAIASGGATAECTG